MKDINQSHLELFANLSNILSQTFKDIQTIFLNEINSRTTTQKTNKIPSPKLAWLDKREEEKVKDSSPEDQNSDEEGGSENTLPKLSKPKKCRIKGNDENGDNKEKKKKKVAKWEQAGKPRPPVNSFMLFLKDTKFEIMEAKPELTPSEISTYASGLWNELTNEEKERYKSEYRNNKAEYEERLKEFHEKEKEKEKVNGKTSEKDDTKSCKKVVLTTPKIGKDILNMKIDMIGHSDESNSIGGI